MFKCTPPRISLLLITAMLAGLLPAAANAEPSAADCTVDCHVNNAAFLNSDWFSVPQSPADTAVYVSELESKRVKYQFADIGVLVDSSTSTNGTLEPVSYAGLAEWIKTSKQTAPNELIIVTLNYGKRVKRVNGVKTANPNFGNATFNTNLDALVNKLLNTGIQIGETGPFYKADGVHLDIEGFMKNDTELLDTLKYLRSRSLAANNYFSMSTPVDPTYAGAVSYQWDSAFIKQAAGVLNMMNPMIYDQMGWGSDIVTTGDYQKLWTDEIVRYSNAIGTTGPNGVPCQLVPTLPSYEKKISEDGTVYHDPLVENLKPAAAGLNAAIAGAQNANVHGAAIFWWSNFIGRNAAGYGPSLSAQDQTNWMNLWVNHP